MALPDHDKKGTVPLRINLTGNTLANAIRTKLEREMKQQKNGYGTGAERIWNKQVLFNLFSRTRSHLQERVLENVPAKRDLHVLCESTFVGIRGVSLDIRPG